MFDEFGPGRNEMMREMTRATIYMVTVMVLILAASNATAKTFLKRIDPEVASPKAVAMAIETYDGEFYDLSDFVNLKKYKGNINQILRKGVLSLSTGDEVDVNAIKYFFTQEKIKKLKKRGKIPADEE